MTNDLRLTRVYPAPEGAFDRSPYADSEDFDEDWWGDWNVIGTGSGDDFYFLVEDASGIEVARALVTHDDIPFSDAYLAPDLSGGYFEIKFFEIAASARRRGFGGRAVGLLRKEFPGSPLIAFSEGGDEFWSALSEWSRFHNQDEPENQLLFISLPRHITDVAGARVPLVL